MLSEDKFFDKADKFALYPTVDGKYYTLEELKATKANQTDKDDKLVILYASNVEEQHAYIEATKEKGIGSIARFSNCFPSYSKTESSNEKLS